MDCEKFKKDATLTLFNVTNPPKRLQSKRRSLQKVTDDDAE